jgi:phytol kinase
MHNIPGIVGSFAFVFSVIGGATLLLKAGVFTPGVTRKVIHIAVSNWWLIAMAAIDALWAALIGPVVFIIINSVSYTCNLFPAMDAGAPKENLGTIYFPISLLAGVLLCYGGVYPLHAGAVGILIMGYGDGGAALAGGRWGRRGLRLFSFQHEKTLAGSSAMFLLSLIVAVTVLFAARQDLPPLLLAAAAGSTAIFATLVELFTPRGIDNLTVPILTIIFYGGLWT